MGRMNKREWQRHEQALDMLWGNDKPIRKDDAFDILEMWNPNALTNISASAAFFTPMALARQVPQFVNMEGRLIDLGAGIGRITYYLLQTARLDPRSIKEIVALEIVPEYVEVGRRLFPEVTWIQGDMFDLELLHSLGTFETGVSNPPFGNVPTTKARWLATTEGSLMAAEVATMICKRGSMMILPENHLPWRFSGVQHNEWKPEEKWSPPYKKLMARHPDLVLGHSSLDTSGADWNGVNPSVELVDVQMEYGVDRPELPALEAIGVSGY